MRKLTEKGPRRPAVAFRPRCGEVIRPQSVRRETPERRNHHIHSSPPHNGFQGSNSTFCS